MYTKVLLMTRLISQDLFVAIPIKLGIRLTHAFMIFNVDSLFQSEMRELLLVALQFLVKVDQIPVAVLLVVQVVQVAVLQDLLVAPLVAVRVMWQESTSTENLLLKQIIIKKTMILQTQVILSRNMIKTTPILRKLHRISGIN